MMNVTINRNIFDEVVDSDYSKHPSEFLNINSIERAEAVMANLSRMEEETRNTKSSYLWTAKKNEFSRQLRWNALRELAGGNERKTAF